MDFNFELMFQKEKKKKKKKQGKASNLLNMIDEIYQFSYIYASRLGRQSNIDWTSNSWEIPILFYFMDYNETVCNEKGTR